MVWKVVSLLRCSVFSEKARSGGRGGQAKVLHRCSSFLLHFAESLGSVVAFRELKPDLEGPGGLEDVGLTLP